MQRLTTLLTPKLAKVTAENQRILGLLSQKLPKATVSRVLHARIDGNTLKLIVGNAAWAARLRFCAGDLLVAIQADYPTATEVNIRVLPASATAVTTREAERQGPVAGDATIAAIREVAKGIRSVDPDPLVEPNLPPLSSPEDQLAKALNRLADNLKSSSLD